MSEITYRPLRLDEAARIREIDASQFIGRAWRDVDGAKQLVEINAELYDGDTRDIQLEYSLY